MKAGVEKARVVGAIVHDERGRRVAAKSGDLLGLCEYFTAPEGLVAELEDARPSFEECRGCMDGVEAEAFQRGGVQDWVDAREKFELSDKDAADKIGGGTLTESLA